MKKIIILCVLLCFILLSCSQPEGGGADNNDTARDNIPDDEQILDTPAALDFAEPDLPEKNYGGAKFNVLFPEWGMYSEFLFADELTGDAMNDALYSRTKKIEEILNIEFNPIMIPRGNDEIKQVLPMVRTAVMAGDPAYDLALIHPMCDLDSFAAGQLVRNWTKIPHINLAQPYWNQSMNDTLAIDDILLFAANDFIISNPSVMYFNKDLVREYNLDNPYELVRNGTWTWDKFTDMAKQVSRDLNGDGLFDENDLYGFSVLLDGSGMISMKHSVNQFITVRDEDGMPVLDLMSERLVSIINKIYDLVWEGDQTMTWTTDIWRDEAYGALFDNFFPRGHTLFSIGSPGTGANEFFRATEVDFGILPYPKYDAAQERYISLEHAGLMLVPQNVRDVEMVGIVAELLGAESRRTTITAYYDINVTHKGVRDEDSLEMLQIIFDNTVYDFGYNYSNFTNTAYIVPRIIAQRSTNVASFYDANASGTERDLERAYNNIIAYHDLDW